MMANFIISYLAFLLAVGNTNGSSQWHASGNSMYRYIATLRSFHDARDYCEKFGGDLAQLKTQESYDYVQKLIGNQSVWLGLTDRHGNCSYQWIDGSPLNNTFAVWDASKACHLYKHCIQLGQGTWRELNCSTRNPFVCQRSDFHRVIKPPADVYQWISNPFAPVSDLKVLVIAPQHQGRIDCKHVTYDNRDALTQHISSSIVSRSISSSSVVHELLLNPDSYYHVAGKLVCGISSEFDGDTTTVSALHLVPDREAEPYFGRFTITAYPGTRIVLGMFNLMRFADLPLLILTWTLYRSGNDRGDSLQPSLHERFHRIKSTSEEDQGTYVTRLNNSENCRVGFKGCAIRLIVPDCPAGRWGPPSCLGVCDPCYNGGICHDLSGSCICPPGFTGENCLTACGSHRFGSECDIVCGLGQGLNMSCAGSQICRPDPYGCSCLSGYTGEYCNKACRAGQYGVNCLQDCHCSQGSACDIFTGECPGDCENGWSGPSCQVPDVCPNGFYGEYCGKICHCPFTASCDRQSGYCVNADGLCAAGYMTEPSRDTYCDFYVGCFDSCTKTCHCSEGASDCNSVTGECYSDLGKEQKNMEGTIRSNLTASKSTNTSSGGIMPWVLFGITLVLLLVLLGVLFGIRVHRRMTSSKLPPKLVSSQPLSLGQMPSSLDDVTRRNQTFSADVDTPDHTYQPLNKAPNTSGTNITMPSSDKDFIDENLPFSAGVLGTPDQAYQPLFKGPNSTKRTPEKDGQNEYEMPISPPEAIYQNNAIKVM